MPQRSDMSFWEFITALGGLSLPLKVVTSICIGMFAFCVLIALPAKGTAAPKTPEPPVKAANNLSAAQLNRDNATGNQYNIGTLNLGPNSDKTNDDTEYRNQLSKFVAEGNSLHSRLFVDRTDQAKEALESWEKSVVAYLGITRPYLAPLFLASATSPKAYANTSPAQSKLIVGLEIRMERLKEYIMKSP